VILPIACSLLAGRPTACPPQNWNNAILSVWYILWGAHIPQADKWKTIESASLNAGLAGTGAWGYVALMNSDVAKADAVPIIGYAVGGEIVGQYIYDGFIKPLWWGSSTKL